jgi:hypothetical protein
MPYRSPNYLNNSARPATTRSGGRRTTTTTGGQPFPIRGLTSLKDVPLRQPNTGGIRKSIVMTYPKSGRQRSIYLSFTFVD